MAQVIDTAPRTLSSVTFANLGTPANGTITYCSDCTAANPTAGSGPGAVVRRENGAWNGGGGSSGGGLGSAAWTTISPSMGTLTPVWTSTVNGNVATISGAVSVPLPTPSGNASGPFYLKIKNSAPTANPITWTGVAETGIPQAASVAANETTVFTLAYDNTVPEWTASAYDPTAAALAAGKILASNGTVGPAVAATAANITAPFTGPQDSSHCPSGAGTMVACSGGGTTGGGPPGFILGEASASGMLLSPGSTTNGGAIFQFTSTGTATVHINYYLVTGGAMGSGIIFGIFSDDGADTAECISTVGTGAKAETAAHPYSLTWTSGALVSGGTCTLQLGQSYRFAMSSDSASMQITQTVGNGTENLIRGINTAQYGAFGPSVTTGTGGSLAFTSLTGVSWTNFQINSPAVYLDK